MFIAMRYLMCSRLFVSLAVTLDLVELADGRIAQSWTYQEMFDEADFVVIARFVLTEDTNERTVLKEHLAEPVDVVSVAAFSVLELNGAAFGGFENAPPSSSGQSPK